jgi:hypothetical protein
MSISDLTNAEFQRLARQKSDQCRKHHPPSALTLGRPDARAWSERVGSTAAARRPPMPAE